MVIANVKFFPKQILHHLCGVCCRFKRYTTAVLCSLSCHKEVSAFKPDILLFQVNFSKRRLRQKNKPKQQVRKIFPIIFFVLYIFAFLKYMGARFLLENYVQRISEFFFFSPKDRSIFSRTGLHREINLIF